VTLPFLDGDELARLLPPPAAVDALEKAFGGSLPAAPPRTRLEATAGELLLMPAVSNEHAGVKLVTVAPRNPGRGLPLIHALYVLLDGATLAPVALVDGAALTALRTAAVSALATRHLARPDASRLVVFGAGVQAAAHLEAMAAVRPVVHAAVVSRSPERAERLADRARDMGMEAEVSGPESVREADLICTCTTASEPLFEGSLVPEGAHINAIGAYRPDAREVDDETVRRARIVVETREAALAEGGDLLIPIGSGVITEAAIVADLAELVGGAAVRRGPDDVTLFKSVGVAFEDLVVAAAAAARLPA
jgi:ornithine cyclodeaminase/alanine dehydrogenase-like protein (mu-crystallin family)